jgi:hypothetical protein
MKRKHRPSILQVGGILFILFVIIPSLHYLLNSPADFDDISSDPKYAKIISQSYKTKIDLRVHGVNLDVNVGKQIHRYSVTPMPGIGGREIISKAPLKIGSVIRVKKVLICSTCFLSFSPRIEMQLEVVSEDSFNDHNVYMGDSFGGVNILIENDGIATLNTEHFEKI